MIKVMTIPFMLLFALVTDKVGSTDEKPPEKLAEKIKNELHSQALNVKNNEENLITIWPRKELQCNAKEEQIKNGLTYRELPETTFFGVIQLHKTFVDFRKQEVPEGIYSLRLAFQPEIGDHKETAPYQEFLLLSPISEESDCDEIDMKKLLETSRKSIKGEHPAVVMLVPSKTEKVEIVESDNLKSIHFTIPIVVNNGKDGNKKPPFQIGLIFSGHSLKR